MLCPYKGPVIYREGEGANQVLPLQKKGRRRVGCWKKCKPPEMGGGGGSFGFNINS